MNNCFVILRVHYWTSAVTFKCYFGSLFGSNDEENLYIIFGSIISFKKGDLKQMFYIWSLYMIDNILNKNCKYRVSITTNNIA